MTRTRNATDFIKCYFPDGNLENFLWTRNIPEPTTS